MCPKVELGLRNGASAKSEMLVSDSRPQQNGAWSAKSEMLVKNAESQQNQVSSP